MEQIYDYVIVGSGFGGSVSAMRLTEKGYSVLVLEKGKRFTEETYAKTNWQFWKYLWMPAIRAHGILQISILKGVMVLHGAGVGGGSLGYSNVLEVPNDETFATPAWNTPIAWGKVLRPHYRDRATHARRGAQQQILESGQRPARDCRGARHGSHLPRHRYRRVPRRSGCDRPRSIFRRRRPRAHGM